MRKTILFTLLAIMLLPCPVLGARKTPRQKLIERLQRLQKRGIMYGHQDDTFYGLTWEWDEDRSDTYALCGDYPAVMGFDLGGIEMGDEKNLDSVPFTRMRREIIRHHERGGIVTISWHPRNPMLGTTAWIEGDIKAYEEAVRLLRKIGQADVAEKATDPRLTVRSVLKGGSHHEKFQMWLERVTDFLVSLKDKKGNAIPVIFRPWHENNGGWFWWGQSNCSTAEYHALWRMTQDAVNAKLRESIVWAYSPNLQGNWTEEQWMERYPGDDRVDLIGEDAYQWGTEEDFVKQMSADMALISKIAREHYKLLAVTECGYKNSPDATWWQRVLKPIIEPYPTLYILPWRNYKKEHFGVAPETTTAQDFKAWVATKKLLLLKGIK